MKGRAYKIRVDEQGTRARLEEIEAGSPQDGQLLVRVEWSSINYKDALAGTGQGKILRRPELTGGIDLCGRIVASADSRFKEGDAVIVTGCGLSETEDGGYADYALVRADWAVPLPAGMSSETAMLLGTAGFTAGLARLRMEQNGQVPDYGPVAVTGATGGVGSIAVDLMAAGGYEVTALSRKRESIDWLQALGAANVIQPDAMSDEGRPLEKAVWGGAIDNVGGDLLGRLVRATRPWGNIAAIGLAGGVAFDATVMPFILRGVSLLGINSSGCPMSLRSQVWERLGGEWSSPRLRQVHAGTVGLDQLETVFEAMLAGQVQGRYLVRVAE